MFKNLKEAKNILLNKNYDEMKTIYQNYLLLEENNGESVDTIENILFGRALVGVNNNVIIKIFCVEQVNL
jgi:uncharacterized SAM-binding protein YcdF (DUF218 family)